MIYGEPVPVEKTTGEKVFAGTINQKGSFQFTSDKLPGDTLLAQIIKMVQDAQGSKAPVQKLVDKMAGIFVPIVIVIAILSLFAWIILGGESGLTQGLLALVTVLVIACPCALGLATPTALMAGIGKGAENGILIKDAESLELTKKISAIVLDKTGTITEGKPTVTDIIWLNNDSSTVNVLISLERQSEHPLAEAVVKHFNEQNYLPVHDFESITGSGARAKIGDQTYYAGNVSLFKTHGVPIAAELYNAAANWISQAKTVIYFGNSKQALAIIAIADNIKDTSIEAIKQIQDMGIDVYILTGDNSTTTKAIAEQVGIKHFKAEVLSAQKAEFIKNYSNR